MHMLLITGLLADRLVNSLMYILFMEQP